MQDDEQGAAAVVGSGAAAITCGRRYIPVMLMRASATTGETEKDRGGREILLDGESSILETWLAYPDLTMSVSKHGLRSPGWSLSRSLATCIVLESR